MVYSCWNLFNIGGMWNMVFGIIIVIGIIALVVWLIIKYSKQGFGVNDKPPFEIAKERYAKGEISKKQFEEMRKELRKR